MTNSSSMIFGGILNTLRLRLSNQMTAEQIDELADHLTRDVAITLAAHLTAEISDALVAEVATSLEEMAMRGKALPPWRGLAKEAVLAVRQFDNLHGGRA